MLSCVLLLPLAQVATGNAVGEAMGWGPASYSVPLSADGSEPATYYGLHAWVTEDFQTLIETGAYPPQLADAGITEAAYMAMLGALVWSFWPDCMGHFDAVCAENGLKIVEPAL